jgi:hypothetical protein
MRRGYSADGSIIHTGRPSGQFLPVSIRSSKESLPQLLRHAESRELFREPGMYKSLIVLGVSLMMTACAGTAQSPKTMAEECSLVDQDATGTKIAVRQECRKVPGGQAEAAPQR